MFEIRYGKAVHKRVVMRACEVKLPPRSMSDLLRVRRVDTAAITKERRRTENKYLAKVLQ